MTVLQRLQTLITLWFVCPGCECATYSGTAGRDCTAAVPAWWRHGERLQFLLLLVQLPCTCACLFSAQMPRCVGSARLVVCLNASPNLYARSQGWRGRVSTLGGRACPLLALQKDGQRFVTSSCSSVQFGTLGFFFASGRSHACWLWEWVWKKTAYPRLVVFLMQCTSHGFWLSFIVITWCSQKYYKNCSVRPLHFAASVVILSFLLFSIFVWLSLFLSAFSFVKWLLYWLVHCIHSLYLIISSDVAA